MSDVIDNRVVQMQFDNKDFDKNIQKSQKSLEDFKKSLNFDDASSQMRAFAQSTNVLSTMADNIQKLTNNFVGIGNIGTEVAKKIHSAWTGAMRSVEQFTKSLTTVQMKTGFEEKYQGSLKAVQTILNAVENSTENQVYDVLGDLMDYADETSYDFADMAKNIGKFTTAGVGLEDAELEMEGIANWAALAGQGVGEAQRAMYNLSQAMQSGYLQKIDYRSIQNASMDIRLFRKEAINAAAAVGSLVKKGDKFYTKKGNKEVNIDNFVVLCKRNTCHIICFAVWKRVFMEYNS
jgi:phage tail tape-measure protein